MKEKAEIMELCEKVKWLHEPEFGDFKRRVGLYLDQFRESLDPSETGLRRSLEELKYQVVYAPNGDMEATRALVISKLKSLG